MTDSWTARENALTVTAYLDMLETELAGKSIVKSHVYRELASRIGRSPKAVEWKFQNVSAVLYEMQHPAIAGLKPATNFQATLRDAVLDQLPRRSTLRQLAVHEALSPLESEFTSRLRLVEAPRVSPSSDAPLLRRAAHIDFVALQAANTRLGKAGELAVVAYERNRLTVAGRSDLAERVEHASDTQGDGLGYDIRSFSEDGNVKFVEVKTTRSSRYMRMLVSRNEVRFSEDNSDAFALYRVFQFGTSAPGLYILPGPISRTCSLDPATYAALPA